MPAAALEQTVARYTELARKCKDEDFGKEPNLMYTIEQGPFYAIPIHSQLLVSVGSLNVDPNMQCLDKEDNPIPGLYAIGNCSASVTGRYYPGAGATLGPAMTFGFLAARHSVRIRAPMPQAENPRRVATAK